MMTIVLLGSTLHTTHSAMSQRRAPFSEVHIVTLSTAPLLQYRIILASQEAQLSQRDRATP